MFHVDLILGFWAAEGLIKSGTAIRKNGPPCPQFFLPIISPFLQINIVVCEHLIVGT